MNDTFISLPKEKQSKIINAALEIFALNDYKKANTDDIAAKANISKGSLFYYFKNKESLYLYILDYINKVTIEYVNTDYLSEITDFFELLSYAAKQKLALVSQHPFMYEFAMRCVKQDKSMLTDRINMAINGLTHNKFEEYFSHIDYSKFRDNVNPLEVFNILIYATEGYIVTLNKTNQVMDINSLNEEFNKWVNLFKNSCYKEEYLDE